MVEMTRAAALAECLEAARRGQGELRACLERYPRLRRELTALVLVAALIPPPGAEGQMSAEARQRGKAELLSRLGQGSRQRRPHARRSSAA
jgi:2-polyprenyl-6-methoxyphenol hydroxylase-like FAD-dependent oxidoreductase